jgi:SAM-dependent methyltransferase
MSGFLPYESTAVRAVTGPAIRPGELVLTRRAADRCRLSSGDRVVDVGCGTGITVDFLKQYSGTRCAGIDLSAGLLHEAKDRDPDLPVMRGNAVELPVRTAGLTAIFCECVLSLLVSAESALNEFYRGLKPGGHLVITDLYLRDGILKASGAAAGIGGCLRGAVDRETMMCWIEAAGFDALLWEDHSPLLKVLAARLAWAGIPLQRWLPNECRSHLGCVTGRPGYFLMIARK